MTAGKTAKPYAIRYSHTAYTASLTAGFFTSGAPMKCCKSCRYFTDAHFSKVYITPTCTAHGGDDAMFMRSYICGVDEARLHEPKEYDGTPDRRAAREDTG